MEAQFEFDVLRRESLSWWHIARRELLREAILPALHNKREARVLDLGCAADLESEDAPGVRVANAHGVLPLLAFQQMEGSRNLICTRPEELAFASNSFDAVVCGDLLQTASDDLAVLREMRRILKDGGLLCVTVPAYMFLWGEEDEGRGHQRRYTASKLRRKLNTCGFEIHRVSYFVATGLLPSMIERLAKDIFKKSATHYSLLPTTSRFANGAMVLLLDLERRLMSYINLPFGTRVVCWARKPAMVTERVLAPAWERQWVRQPLPQGSNFTALPESGSSR